MDQGAGRKEKLKEKLKEKIMNSKQLSVIIN